MQKTTLGADIQRVDGRDKVVGAAIYGADRKLPRMAHAVPVVATIGKGRIMRIDTEVAARTPGVLLVLTHLDMDRLKPISFSFAGGQAIQSMMPMQSAEIAYRGQAIALVVAQTLEAAAEGAGLVTATYEEEAFSVRLDAAGREEVSQNEKTQYFKDIVHGDADQAMAAAPFVFDRTYLSSPQHQNPMELLSTVAEWRRGRLFVHEGTQAAQAMKQGLAIALDIPPERIHVISPYVGGAFGQRGSISPHTVFAAVAARRLGRPVKLTVPRSQIFHATSFRPATQHRIRIGTNAEGQILTGIHEVRSQTSRFDLMPYTGQETTGRMYGWKDFRGSTQLAKLDTQTPGFMRAPMEMASFFALESAIDELAIQHRMDPVAFRLKNDAASDPISGKPFSSRRLKDCLTRGAELFGWDNRDAEPGSMRDPDGTLIGWGVAVGAYPGYIAPALAIVRMNREGAVFVSVGGHEMGQGIRTAIAVVVAAELGIDPEKVTIVIGDTRVPPQHTTAGAWGAATATPPVQHAARQLRFRLVEMASKRRGGPLFGHDLSALTLVDGHLIGSGGRNESVDSILKAAKLDHVEAQAPGSAPGLRPTALQEAAVGKIAFAGPEFPDWVTFSFIAHFVEVRVDPRIPRPRVTRVVSVVDCGQVISSRTAHSQVYGGVVWGIGAALTEASEVDSRFGGFLNNNIAEYQIAVNADVRQIDVEFIKGTDSTFNTVGAKGVGEVACVGAAAAIANAVHHATGKRVRTLPIRVEDLLV